MILGSRGSPLALAQSGWVRDKLMEAHQGLSVSLKVIRTTGDRHQATLGDAPLDASMAGDGKGIFVKEIEEGMLAGEIDLAVHSLKDLPTDQPPGLTISAIPAREDPRDVLVTPGGLSLEDLPAGARLGTGSPRRASQILAARSDLVIKPVRGNVETRVRKMLEGGYEATVLAAAGLIRLGALDEPSNPETSLFVVGMVSYISDEVCVPAVGQGALAIETREDDERTRSVVAILEDAATTAATDSERAFLASLGGGCRIPVAALARVRGDRMMLRGIVASPDGSRLIRVKGEGASSSGVQLGRDLAADALARGADALLKAIGG